MQNNHSTRPHKNPETTNPIRKWNKKYRNAKTPEEKEFAEQMIRALTHKKKKPTKVEELSDDQLLDIAIKENKRIIKSAEFIELTKQAKYLQQLDNERANNRRKIKEGVAQGSGTEGNDENESGFTCRFLESTPRNHVSHDGKT